MSNLSANIRLRPTRIGFLVEPDDMDSVRKIMSYCACLWGGAFNPIIPAYSNDTKLRSVSQRYIRYFEPDVFVEAKEGMLESVGLDKIKSSQAITHKQVSTLSGFFNSPYDKGVFAPSFGLNICDVFENALQTEQRFVRRDRPRNLIVPSRPDSALTEAIFGAYPDSESFKYIREAFEYVYSPEKIDAAPEAWLRLYYLNDGTSPLHVTLHGLEWGPSSYRDRIIFVFDPSEPADLIALWNRRLDLAPVIPLPINWLESLAGTVREMVVPGYRQIDRGLDDFEPQAVVEFAPSISEKKAKEISQEIKTELPSGAFYTRLWREPILEENRRFGRRFENIRKIISAGEKNLELFVDEDSEMSAAFESLSPNFASKYAMGDFRWVNVVRTWPHGKKSIAHILPFNQFDRTWPRLQFGNDAVFVTSEGWVFPQHWTSGREFIRLQSSDEAIISYLSQIGIKAELSDPGHIAKQMLEQLGGLRDVHLLANMDTLYLLNKMSNKQNLTATLGEWKERVNRQNKDNPLPVKSLHDFTKRNVIQVGVETDCPHCKWSNWSALDDVGYKIVCKRCLKEYEFPQADLRSKNGNWVYRIIGPFSVSDYGRGAYSTLLALRFLGHHRMRIEMTYATSLNLELDGAPCEIDFFAWLQDSEVHDRNDSPVTIIGETKSTYAKDAITEQDINTLKKVAKNFTSAVIVIAVLRDNFTDSEKAILREFAEWGRKIDEFDNPSYPVLLLTRHELLFEHYVSLTWKNLGGIHAEFYKHDYIRNLADLADATQQIYLDMPPFSQSRDEQWRQRAVQRQSKTRKT